MRSPSLSIFSSYSTILALGDRQEESAIKILPLFHTGGSVYLFVGVGALSLSLVCLLKNYSFFSFVLSHLFHCDEDSDDDGRKYMLHGSRGGTFLRRYGHSTSGYHTMRRTESRSESIIEALNLFWSYWGRVTENVEMDLLSTSSSSSLLLDWENDRAQRSISEAERSRTNSRTFPGSFLSANNGVSPLIEKDARRMADHWSKDCSPFSLLYLVFSAPFSTCRELLMSIIPLPYFSMGHLWRMGGYRKTKLNHPSQKFKEKSEVISTFSSLPPEREDPPDAPCDLSPLPREQGKCRSENQVQHQQPRHQGKRNKEIKLVCPPLENSVGENSDEDSGWGIRKIMYLLKNSSLTAPSFSVLFKSKDNAMNQKPSSNKRWRKEKTSLPSHQLLEVSVAMDFLSSCFEPLIPTLGRCPTVVLFRVSTLDTIEGDYCSYAERLIKQMKLDSCFSEDDLVDVLYFVERHPPGFTGGGTGVTSCEGGKGSGESGTSFSSGVSHQEKGEEEGYELPSPSSSTAHSTATTAGMQYSSVSLTSGEIRVELYPARMFYLSFYLSLLLQEKNNAILSISGETGHRPSHSSTSISVQSSGSALHDFPHQRSCSSSSSALPYFRSPPSGYMNTYQCTGQKGSSKSSYYLSGGGNVGQSLSSQKGKKKKKNKYNECSPFCTGMSGGAGGSGDGSSCGKNGRRVPDKIFYDFLPQMNFRPGETGVDAGEDKSLEKGAVERKIFKESDSNKTGSRCATTKTFSHSENNSLSMQVGDENKFCAGGTRAFMETVNSAESGGVCTSSTSPNAGINSPSSMTPFSASSMGLSVFVRQTLSLSTGHWSDKMDSGASSSSFSPPSSSPFSVVVHSRLHLHYLSKRSTAAIRSADSWLLNIRSAMDESVKKYWEKKQQANALCEGNPEEGGRDAVMGGGFHEGTSVMTSSGRKGGSAGAITMLMMAKKNFPIPSDGPECPTNSSCLLSPGDVLLHASPYRHSPHFEGGQPLERPESSVSGHFHNQSSSINCFSLEVELGVPERQRRRDRILNAVGMHILRVCTIPLPDNRIYCDIPGSVSRVVAAHARGFSPVETLAEDWTHYNQFLSFLLEQREDTHHGEEQENSGYSEAQKDYQTYPQAKEEKRKTMRRVAPYDSSHRISLFSLPRKDEDSASNWRSTKGMDTYSVDQSTEEQENLREKSMEEYFLSSHATPQRRRKNASESPEGFFSLKTASPPNLGNPDLSFVRTAEEGAESCSAVSLVPSMGKEGASSSLTVPLCTGTNSTSAATNPITTNKSSNNTSSTSHTVVVKKDGGYAISNTSLAEGLTSSNGVQHNELRNGPLSSFPEERDDGSPVPPSSFSASLGLFASGSSKNVGDPRGEGFAVKEKYTPRSEILREDSSPSPLHVPASRHDTVLSGVTSSPLELLDRMDPPTAYGLSLPSSTTFDVVSIPKPSREVLLFLRGDFCYQSFVRNVDRLLSGDACESYTSKEKWKENGRCMFYVFTNSSAFLFSASAGTEVNVEDDFWLYEESNEAQKNKNSNEDEGENGGEDSGEKTRKRLNKTGGTKSRLPSLGLHLIHFSGSPFRAKKHSVKEVAGKEAVPAPSRDWGVTCRLSTCSTTEVKFKMFYQVLKEIRDRRNAPLLPLFRYVHSHFFDTITRPLGPPSPAPSSPPVGSTSCRWYPSHLPTSSSPRPSTSPPLPTVNVPASQVAFTRSKLLYAPVGLLTILLYRCLEKMLLVFPFSFFRTHPVKSKGMMMADAEADTPVVEKKICSSHLPSSSAPSGSSCEEFSQAPDQRRHIHTSSIVNSATAVRPTNTTTTSSTGSREGTSPPPRLRCFGGHITPLSEVDRTNSQYGLTPLEAWMCMRYSQRCAAEMYMMDVLSAKGDTFIPTTRVIDEVVSHAIFVHYNFSLKEFVEDLQAHFNLNYTPKTLWGRRTLSEENPDLQNSPCRQRGSRIRRAQAMRQEIVHEEEKKEEQREVKSVFENKWDADIVAVAEEYFGNEEEEMNLKQELVYLKLFLIHHRHTLSSAMFTPERANRLESLFGVPSTVFPFLLCQRESVSLVHAIYQNLNNFYGELTYGHFYRFVVDVFQHDRPDVVRHGARIFRTLNRSRTGSICYEELCGWLARKLSCGSEQHPDTQLLTVLMSLRLPMALLVDRQQYWSQRDVAFRFSLDGEDEFR